MQNRIQQFFLGIHTSEGILKLEQYSNQTPITVSNVLAYIDSNIYDKTLFYRTVKSNNQPNNDVKKLKE